MQFSCNSVYLRFLIENRIKKYFHDLRSLYFPSLHPPTECLSLTLVIFYLQHQLQHDIIWFIRLLDCWLSASSFYEIIMAWLQGVSIILTFCFKRSLSKFCLSESFNRCFNAAFFWRISALMTTHYIIDCSTISWVLHSSKVSVEKNDFTASL